MNIYVSECVADAAQREVLEETGVKTKFIEILGFRHSHKIQFGRSDMYVFCHLEAENTKIVVDEEIEEAQWMELDAFRAQNKYGMLTPLTKILMGESN